MIKTLLKYIIAEVAINKLFNNVNNNFIHIHNHKFEMNQIYDMIKIVYISGDSTYKMLYFNCIVKNTTTTEFIFITFTSGYNTELTSNGKCVTHDIIYPGHCIIDINNIVSIKI